MSHYCEPNVYVGIGKNRSQTMDDNVADLVAASRLETEFRPGCVLHRFPTADETWDIRNVIGRGASGVVRREERRVNPPPPPEPQVRAVKQMAKQPNHQSVWTYRHELAAIVKFSQPQYAPHFVSFLGWFENDESVFVAMEYLAAGDLENFRNASGPFSEPDTSQIVRQLVEGVRHMHESGFAHRDLKPGNILISSTAPAWHVKIADFGISKQALQGVTHQHTMNMFGTPGYAAPEALGYFDDETITYTMSVDIWGVGVIGLTLLLGRMVFPRPWDLWQYINHQRPLGFSRQQGGELTEECRDFITHMLAIDPVVRPTAIAVLAHPWLRQALAQPPSDDIEMSDAQQPGHGDHSSPQDDCPIKQEPEPDDNKLRTLPDSGERIGSETTPEVKVETKDDVKLQLYPPRDPATLEQIHKHLALDSALLTPKLRGLLFAQTRYFILRSNNQTDVETSAALGMWTSSERVNKILNKAYAASGGHVVMLFSVVKSRKFCGIARMTSPLDWTNTDPDWVEDVWLGRFTLEWLSHAELSFDRVKHVPVKESTPGFRAISCYDGQEISRGSAWELLRAYSAEESVANARRRAPPPAPAVPGGDAIPSAQVQA